MNGPFVQQQAAALAARVMREKTARSEQIRRAFSLCFNRPPDTAEQTLAESFFQHAASESSDEAALMARYCQSLLATAEFRCVD
jgi:hypothetical protein